MYFFYFVDGVEYVIGIVCVLQNGCVCEYDVKRSVYGEYNVEKVGGNEWQEIVFQDGG